jgi:mRNA-degrading endonuclease RelE of RelBE toxin-antitoxin system
MEAELPEKIREICKTAFNTFQSNPNHPGLETKLLHDSKEGKHRNGSRSVRITLRYRAIYVIDNGPDGKGPEQAFWYWIGSREEYANFIRCR